MSAKFHRLEYVCKICKRKGTALGAWECPSEWIDKLHPMLVCNRCGDAIAGRERALRDIGRLCLIATIKDADLKAIRVGLSTAARLYFESIAVLRGTGIEFKPKLVDEIMDSPEDWGQILARYKRGIRLAGPLSATGQASGNE